MSQSCLCHESRLGFFAVRSTFNVSASKATMREASSEVSAPGTSGSKVMLPGR